MNQAAWWQGAIIYQIYPRSFQDTDGDGVGDLPGILQRLDYVASLGVEAVWISPFFKSPMADFGYDIADYRAVDPVFGTMADFDAVLEKAHRLGIKIIIDQVLSHTSIEHAWFQASRESRDNPYANWYVWADPRDDGSPPNNWLSIFGGVAWKWEPRRSQYYLHNFLAEQPDLNFHEPAVRKAVLDNVRFWLDRGVDGLRLDAINFCFHDAQLRDNPPKPPEKRAGRGFRSDNPYAYQYHFYNNTQPENLSFLGDLRELLEQYPGSVTLGEISSEDSIVTMAEYTQPGRLHMAYSFELLGPNGSAAHIKQTVEKDAAIAPSGWPCWAISNHDVVRVVSRWGKPDSPRHLATQLTALICSLRGAVCVYQGEELGLGEADVPFDQLRDPYGITFWPKFKGRDGCRTPMPWTNTPHGGFSGAQPWLPVPAEHLDLAVELQGEIEFIVATDDVLAFRRSLPGENVIAVFNLRNAQAEFSSQELLGARAMSGHGLPEGQLSGGLLTLPAHGVFFGAS
jgi:alpha-glucosidase